MSTGVQSALPILFTFMILIFSLCNTLITCSLIVCVFPFLLTLFKACHFVTSNEGSYSMLKTTYL